MKTFASRYEDDSGKKNKRSRRSMRNDDSYVRNMVSRYSDIELSEMIEENHSDISARHIDQTGRSIFRSQFGIHAKMEISQPGDASEMQADQWAESFMNGDADHSQQILSQPISEVSRMHAGDAMSTTGEFDSKLQGSKGGGQKLDDDTRAELEEHSGTDLSGVNIHTGPEADALNQQVNGRAFAHGEDIYFREGEYNPESEEGKELLAHEVAHVVQEGNHGLHAKIYRQTDPTITPDSVYTFKVPVDKLYTNEHDWLQHCLSYIFSLTPGDANIFIEEGWHFTSEYEPIKQTEIGSARRVTVSVSAYKRIMGEFAVRHPGSDLGKWLLELIAQLEKVKQRYDEAYKKYGIVVDEVLREHGYQANPYTSAEPVSTYVAPPADVVLDPNYGETEDERIIREEMEKTDDAFSELDREYPDVQWSYKASYKSLEMIADIVMAEFRKTHSMNDEAAEALTAAMVREYRTSKRKALHAILAPQLQDQSSSPFDELLFYETLSNNSRQLALENGIISQELVTSYATAHADIIRAELEYKTSGSVSISTGNIVQFYTDVREFVEEMDVPVSAGYGASGNINDYLEESEYDRIKKRGEEAGSSIDDWTEIFADFRTASNAMDKLIAKKMKESKNEDVVKAGQYLQTTSEAATELDDLLLHHAPVYKVNAIYYTQGVTDYWNDIYTKESVLSQGYKMQMYLYKEGEEWVLRDLSRAGSGDPIPTNRSTGSLDQLFAELDSKLRFPEGKGTLYWEVPALDEGGTTEVTGDMTLSEWFTYIGLALAAILLAISTLGVSIPVTAVVLTSAVLITGSVLSMMEKSEQGVLTAKDVVIELANIVSAASAGITAGLGKIILRGVGTTGNAARLAVMADRLYFPVAVSGLAADVVSYATITAEALQQYQELDSMPDGPAKDEAKKRLFANFLLQESVMILSIKQDIPALTGKTNLVLTKNLSGELVARQDFTEQIALAKASNDPDKVLEGQVAEWVQNDLVYFQKKIPPETGSVTEIDIEFEDIIIEVGSGSKKKMRQIKQRVYNQDNVNPENKAVILYGPNFKGAAQRDIENIGAYVVHDQKELLETIKLIRNKK